MAELGACAAAGGGAVVVNGVGMGRHWTDGGCWEFGRLCWRTWLQCTPCTTGPRG